MSRHGMTVPEPQQAGLSGMPKARGSDGATVPWDGPARPAATQREARRPSGFLASWTVRRKLIALVTLPILGIVGTAAFIGLSTVQDLTNARTIDRLAQLASLAQHAKVSIEDERAQTIAYLDSHNSTAEKSAMEDKRKATDAALAQLDDTLHHKAPVGGWPDSLAGEIVRIDESRQTLNERIRPEFYPQRNPSTVVASYQDPVDGCNAILDALINTIESSNAASNDTRALVSILSVAIQLSDTASTDRDLITYVLVEKRITDKRYQDILGYAAQETQLVKQLRTLVGNNQSADVKAEAGTIDQIDNDDAQLARFRQDLQKILPDNLADNPEGAGDSKAFTAAAWIRVNRIDSFFDKMANKAQTTTSASVRKDLWRTVLFGGVTLIASAIMLLLVLVIARSIDRPLRRLTSGAVELASVQLPIAVRTIEDKGPDAVVDLPSALPPGTSAGPEAVELANAVDGLSGEAVRLAAAQVRLRRALDDAFVSMSRRSQSMVEKQLTIIDELESTEQDPEQLRNLFRLDHLAARMRRYNDNLLVLAGSAVRTRSAAPVPIAELFRAATSEMEQYERVRLQPVGGAAIPGPSAGGLIHLLAELLDNAAMYSPPTSPIVLSAAFTPDGGLLLEVADSGVGIPAAELDRINLRLNSLQEMDTQVPSRMGLFVVGRLANRGGLHVRLTQRSDGPGTIAEVAVPASLVLGAPGQTTENQRLGTPATGIPQRAVMAPEPSTPSAPIAAVPQPSLGYPDSPAYGRQDPTYGRQDPGYGRPDPGYGRPAPSQPAAASTPPPSSPAGDGPGGGLPRRPLGSQRTGAPLGAYPASTDPITGSLFLPSSAESAFGASTPAQGARTTGGFEPQQPTSNPVGLPRTGPTSATANPFRTDPFGRTPNTGAPHVSSGAAPGAWDNALPSELAARTATPATPLPAAPQPSGPPLIGSPPPPVDDGASTPIFDSISAWFADEKARTGPIPIPVNTPPSGMRDPAPSRPAPQAPVTPVRPIVPTTPGYGQPSTPGYGQPASPMRAPEPVRPAPEPARPAYPSYAPAAASAPRPTTGEQPLVRTPAREPEPAREEPARVAAAANGGGSGSRWSALGDQRWLAANARAAAAPEVAGTTTTGLPRRRPGANLLPTASAAAPGAPRAVDTPPPPVRPAGVDAETIRGRLGSYQRGLSSARQARLRPGDHVSETVASGLFGTASTRTRDRGGNADEQPGGNQ